MNYRSFWNWFFYCILWFKAFTYLLNCYLTNEGHIDDIIFGPHNDLVLIGHHLSGINLCMRPANGRRRYIVTSSLIGWAHMQNDPCLSNQWQSRSVTSYISKSISPLVKMAAVSQTIYLDAFSWMKSFVFWWKFHWSLFLRVQLTIHEQLLR